MSFGRYPDFSTATQRLFGGALRGVAVPRPWMMDDRPFIEAAVLHLCYASMKAADRLGMVGLPEQDQNPVTAATMADCFDLHQSILIGINVRGQGGTIKEAIDIPNMIFSALIDSAEHFHSGDEKLGVDACCEALYELYDYFGRTTKSGRTNSSLLVKSSEANKK